MRILAGLVCAVLLSPVTSATADTVTCGDGTTSVSGRGACSHRGGVIDDRAKPRAERPRATKRSQARKATVRKRTQAGVTPDTDSILCNDGTVATPIRRGACSDHGGISDGAERFERHDGPIRERRATRPAPGGVGHWL